MNKINIFQNGYFLSALARHQAGREIDEIGVWHLQVSEVMLSIL